MTTTGELQLRVATCVAIPEPDQDEALLAAALDRAGVRHALLGWDDPAVDWDAPIPTVLRSTWNYSRHIDAFVAWVGRVAAVAPLVNPPDVVLGNVRKRYLLELAARGVPVVPTTLVTGDAPDAALPAGRFVVKPEVGAGSWLTRTFEPGEDAAARDHLAEVLRWGDALVQPYVASVDDYGERSLVWIDGELSHAIRKSPRFSGDRESTTGPLPIADDERAVAARALAPVVDRILYGRVDLARDDAGRPMVMELELVEPSLFFARGDGSVDRYVAALKRRLRLA
jgi:glutathione synthase/RimK-type ligase-like ATP-grasp enzyme